MHARVAVRLSDPRIFILTLDLAAVLETHISPPQHDSRARVSIEPAPLHVAG
jgi:hypothetical protein